MNKLLRGISVLDMTEGVAGPCASSLLGDMGASIIKVERPEGGLFLVSNSAFANQHPVPGAAG